VNKVSTAVDLRFEAERSPNLTPAVKARLKRLAGRRWTLDGAILIRAEETRSQLQNRELARERLAELIRQALVAPKRRVATKPTYGSQLRRLKQKTVRGEVKTLRGKVDDE
jgi:ribosome-associated protein